MTLKRTLETHKEVRTSCDVAIGTTSSTPGYSIGQITNTGNEKPCTQLKKPKGLKNLGNT